jgi:hypothetical protein
MRHTAAHRAATVREWSCHCIVLGAYAECCDMLRSVRLATNDRARDLPVPVTRTFRTAAKLFSIVFIVHATSFVVAQGDSRWTIPQALSLIHEHNFDLDEYASLFPSQDYYFIECVSTKHHWTWPVNQTTCPGGHFYYLYPPAVSVVAVPFVAVIQAVVHVLHPMVARFTKGPPKAWQAALFALLNEDLVKGSPAVEIIIASLFVAAATAVLFLALFALVSKWEAVLLALTFAFCTSAWSTASRSLASHAPSILLNSLCVLLLCRSARRPRHLWIIGPLAALAFFVRPPNLIPAGIFGIYLLRHAPRQALFAALAALPVAAFFAGASLQVYGTILPPYFTAPRDGHSLLALHTHFLEALAGNWVSPARGMLVYCPFLAMLLLPAAWRTDLGPVFRRLRPYFIAIAALWWLVVSMHIYWWAGWAFGPRYMCDLFPFIILLMAPVVHAVFQCRPGIRLDRAALAATLALALFIHARGSYSLAVHDWDRTPKDVDFAPSRVWDWSDIPFLRGL